MVLDDENGNLIAPVIRNGRPAKGMPAVVIGERPTADIVAFLHPRAHLAADRSTYVIQGLLTGDPKAGEAYFNGEAKCHVCHSPSGDLSHTAGEYDAADLQSRFLYLSPPRHSQADATVTLPSGEAILGKLVSLDDFDVALRDSSGWYRSYPRESVKISIRDPLAAHRELLPKYTDANMHDILAYLETLK